MPGLSGCSDGAGLSGDSGLSAMKTAEQSGPLLLASPRTSLSGLQLMHATTRGVNNASARWTRYTDQRLLPVRSCSLLQTWQT